MKSPTLLLILICGLCAGVSSAGVVETFSRDDPGANWQIKKGNASIVARSQLYNTESGELLLVYTGETLPQSGWQLQADMRVRVIPSRWVGVVFNYQPDGSCYAVRFQNGTYTYQFFRMEANGEISHLQKGNSHPSAFTRGGFLRVDVRESEPGRFLLTVSALDNFDGSTQSAILSNITLTDPGASPLKGGYAGLIGSPGETDEIRWGRFQISGN